MNIPFAYSSNGDAFYEHDFLTGAEREISLNEFPSYDELVSRYKAQANNGNPISDIEDKILNQPYYTSQSNSLLIYKIVLNIIFQFIIM